ncbi:ALDH-like protein [Thozetella sp. PMI_491]|nr:ALDH-like protein [Thozetella sp. PMI_491]
MTQPRNKEQTGSLCVPCLVNGEAIIQPPEANFPVVSAKTQKVIHYGQSATTEIAIRAVESARDTFVTYKKTPAHERRRLLLRAAELFENKIEEGMARQIKETSCDEHWATFNATNMSVFCRAIAVAVESAVTGSLPPTHSGVPQLVIKEAVGPVLVVVPWNGALILCVRAVACALAAGCTVVLKASELCPWTHQLVVDTFLEAGFPPGSINMIMADRSAGPQITEATIAHPAIRKVEFIGSTAVGKAVGVMAAKHLKPLIMELGDQSPAIVLDDADLEKAAELCLRGSMLLHGQVCFTTERIIVQAAVKDKFLDLLVAAFKKLPDAGTAVSIASAEKAKAAVDDAIRRGAKFLCGSSDLIEPASLAPSILTDVPADSILSTEEGFGPTVFVTTVGTDDEAIAEANSRDGGLSASIFTGNFERGWNMAKELEFGQVQLNQMTNHAEPGGPLPGWKGSGWGSHAGRYGIELFLQDKTVFFYPSGSLNK